MADQVSALDDADKVADVMGDADTHAFAKGNF